MNIKIKSLFKIACYATAVVIFCYLERKYNITFHNTEKSGMASHMILSSEFEVFGTVQGKLLNLSNSSTSTLNNCYISCRCFLPQSI